MLLKTIIVSSIILNTVNCYELELDKKFPINDTKNVVIGVLAQQYYEKPKLDHQYIVASYIKFVQASGARVVPVFLRENYEYYDNLLPKLDGILLPGGGSLLDEGPYSDAVDYIIEFCKKKYNEGYYFPIWTTCLSFQKVIANALNNDIKWRSLCNAHNKALNLTLNDVNSLNETRMFRNDKKFNPNILNIILSHQNVTPHFHYYCITVDEWNNHTNLTNNFNMIAYSYNYNDKDKKEYKFVSLFEHKKYPIYGSAWHPEKAAYERHGNTNHDLSSILTGQYFGNFFIEEARRSKFQFKNKTELDDNLIYNYNKYRFYTANTDTSDEIFEEMFIFPDNK